jgi:nitrite reductase/ring-hydroxylating ferredoxin subunit/uncharacterized membrane protein
MDVAPTKLSDRLIDELPWLDTVAETIRTIAAPLLGQDAPRPPRDLLYGTWLGHPLHPALVVLPLGFWTSTLVFDLLGEERAADLTLGLGLVGAAGAAASGVAQWQDAVNQDAPRRLGALHATLNGVATVLYGASWLARRGGARRLGVALSTLGYGISGFSAWLGGDLAYDRGIGVSRTAFQPLPEKWTDVLAATELEEGKPRRIEVDGTPIMLLRRGDAIVALAATCSHLGGPLDRGRIDGDTVTCPWHGSVFSLRDGAVRHGPATIDQPAFAVRVERGRIEVKAR